MAGCAISVALFIAAMDLLLKAGGMQCRCPKAEDSPRHPACRAYHGQCDGDDSIYTGDTVDLERIGKDGNMVTPSV